jgi:hypothetical protein
LASADASLSEASIAVDRKAVGHTVAERSCKDADFPCISYFLAWWLWKSVVTLAVTVNTTFCPVVRCRRMPVFQRYRLPLTGSRWVIRWLSGRGKTPTLCVFPVFSAAVLEKCRDSSGDWEYYFRSGCLVSADANVSEVSTAVSWKSIGHTVAERSCKDGDFLCTSCI